MLKILRNHSKIYLTTSSRSYNTNYKKSVTNFKDGSSFIFESGRLARFADGSIILTHGDNSLLSTTVKGKTETTQDFLGLTTEYRPSGAAVGKIPSNALRREFLNSDYDILTARCIDRSLRPLFKQNYPFPIQIICKPLAFDDDCDPIVMSINASSASAYCANLPLITPVGAVRIGLVDDRIIINPNKYDRKQSSIDLLFTGTDDKKIIMLEMEGKEIPKEIFYECINEGFSSIESIISSIKKLNPDFIPINSLSEEMSENDKKLKNSIIELADNELTFIFTDVSLDKEKRDEKINKVLKEIMKDLKNEFNTPDYYLIISKMFYKVVKDILRRETIESKIRMDGRKLDEIRPISMEVDIYKKLHGSAIFQRGQSQVFSTVTFDSPEAAFRPDSISQLFGGQEEKKFIHHYEFPGFAINEIQQSSRQNRREIGHGMLAEKALKNIIPKDFPYSIRLNTQVLESNGSTSMAAVVGGTLALRDAGVHIKAPVAGIAMGLMTEEYCSESTNKVLLTDLNGLEDYAGDMDFKIAGTANGFTAMQLDIKIPGLSFDLMKESINESRKALNFILDKILILQPNVRSEFKKSVPIIDKINISMKCKVGLYQNGGYNHKLIESETGVKIKSEEDLQLRLFAPNREKLEEAKRMILELQDTDGTAKLIFGGIYDAEIVEILKSGFMIKFQRGTKPVFIKNSDIAGGKAKIFDSSVFKKHVGDKIKVSYYGDDPSTGKMRLSCLKY
uniref:Polyribonucleotide nucleotidyltransferase n=1 Tax=Parastrongyloides trichosuri TaxID=131310 RepID=A0A0N4ZRQ3_PARTI